MEGRARVVRAVVYALVLPWVLVCLWKTHRGPWIYPLGVLLVGAIAYGIGRSGWLRYGWLRAVELVLWNAVLVLVALEIGVRAYLAFGSPPSWLSPDPDVVLYRLNPSSEWLGHAPNSRGFYDLEFEPRQPGRLRVVAIGDSYTVGIVPYPQNYLTQVDEALGPEIEILNLGVVHTEIPHYHEILLTEGLQLQPDAVLVGIYIGNDIKAAPPRGLFSRAGSRLFRSIRVLNTVIRHGAPYREDGDLTGLFEEAPDGSLSERPGMTVEKHYRREWKHLRRLFRPPESERMQRAWRDTLQAIDDLVETCRELGIPLLATLAPDEIEVSDEVFAATLRHYDASPEDFDLDYPRRQLLARLEQHGVPVLDFRDALREADREAPTYHLRAVHWNRRGNAVAAELLLPWLSEQLAEP